MSRFSTLPILSAIVALIGGVDSASAGSSSPPSALPVAALGEICQGVLGATAGEAHYQGCVESLSGSLIGLQNDRGLEEARATCLASGFKPGAPQLAACTLTHKRDQALPIEVAPVSSVTIPGGKKSYAWASNADRRAREQLACAMIGFDPTSGGFGGCVAGLAATLFALDNPQN